jgi:hypothetical protein
MGIGNEDTGWAEGDAPVSDRVNHSRKGSLVHTDGRTLIFKRHRATAPLPFPLPVESREAAGPLALTACSVCLRVWQGSEWIEPEAAIRKLRSFDLGTPPQLRAGLCDQCVHSLEVRRAGPAETLAA